jgi:diacylglycerol kinase
MILGYCLDTWFAEFYLIPSSHAFRGAYRWSITSLCSVSQTERSFRLVYLYFILFIIGEFFLLIFLVILSLSLFIGFV